MSGLRYALKGAVGPRDNDSRFLLDVHSRQLPGEDTMRRYDDSDAVEHHGSLRQACQHQQGNTR